MLGHPTTPSRQHVIAKSESSIPADDYKLVVKSRGGDAEGPLQSVSRNVKYISLPPVGVTNAYSFGRSDHMIVHPATHVCLDGWGLLLGESDTVTYSGTCEGNPVSGAFPYAAALENTDEHLCLDYMQTTGDTLMFDSGSTFTLTLHGVTVSVEFQS